MLTLSTSPVILRIQSYSGKIVQTISSFPLSPPVGAEQPVNEARAMTAAAAAEASFIFI